MSSIINCQDFLNTFLIWISIGCLFFGRFPISTRMWPFGTPGQNSQFVKDVIIGGVGMDEMVYSAVLLVPETSNHSTPFVSQPCNCAENRLQRPTNVN